MVPFRQCKLTELLFSNSFPSPSTTYTHHRAATTIPQKAIMIVTADATGDFNATSQILRYSALAREITVPRIPSVSSTILSNARPGSSSSSTHSDSHSGASTPPSAAVMAELARLADEVAVLAFQIEDERERRAAAERGWAASEERVELVERQVREECWREMEQVIEMERGRWRGALEGELGRGEERVDRKIEILARGAIEDGEEEEERRDGGVDEPEGRSRLLEEENERLRARIELLEREKLCKTPCTGKKQRVFRSKKWEEVDLDASS
jgi:hypothetical protein